MQLRKIVLHEGNEVLQQNEMKMIRAEKLLITV